MTQPESEICCVKTDWDSIAGIHRFPHQAMATTFEILIAHEDAQYAQQAAWEAFGELDNIEAELSRFVENSDISRINNLAASQPLPIGLAAFECLQISARIYDETNGAFDITIGHLLSCWLSENKTARTPSEKELEFARQHTGTDLLKLNETDHTVELLTSPVQIDLGGMGKGYAVDKMAELLRDWSIDTALVHAGFSSVLALGCPSGTKGWPVTFSNPRNRKETLAFLNLRDRALSGSGLQKGRHIIDPRTYQPVEGKLAAWASASTAATADALSTAFMVMSPDDVEQYCLNHSDSLAMVILEKSDKEKQRDNILRFGHWDEFLV
jgi:thiamine biosynthesis lipoprotein